MLYHHEAFRCCLLDLSILDHDSISLTSEVAKELGSIKVEVQGLGEVACRVPEKAELD